MSFKIGLITVPLDLEKDINVIVDSSNNGENYVCKATTSIKKGDIVFSMPMGLCLDSSKAASKFSSIIF